MVEAMQYVQQTLVEALRAGGTREGNGPAATALQRTEGAEMHE
jgi:hypothetical protein